MPGGTVGADKLLGEAVAVRFVRGIVEAGKPAGVICHGPWTLIEADVVRGRTLTAARRSGCRWNRVVGCALGPDLADRLRLLRASGDLRRANGISGVVRHGTD